MSSAQANGNQQLGNDPQMLQILKKPLLDTNVVKELAEQNAALKQHLLSQKNSWVQEKNHLQAWYKKLINAKVQELKLCTDDLVACQNKNSWFQNQLKVRDEKITSLEDSFAKSLGGFNETWEAQMRAKEAELQAMQDSYNTKIDQIMKEKDAEISFVRGENTALEKMHLDSIEDLQAMRDKLQKCESDLEAKTNALQEMTTSKEKKMAVELRALQESFNKKIELIISEKDKKLSSVRHENMALATLNNECRLELLDMRTKLQEYESDCEDKTNALQQATSKEKKMAVELRALQESLNKKIELIISEKDKEISSVTSENMALEQMNKECRLELLDMRTKLKKCQSDCEDKTNALQQATTYEEKIVVQLQTLKERCKKIELMVKKKDRKISGFIHENNELVKLKQQLVQELEVLTTMFKNSEARVDDLQQRLCQETKEKEELHRKTVEIEERLNKNERSWLLRTTQMEKDMESLATENTELQELACKTDKEKAKIRKDEEKRLKEELKQQKKQEKKEREEREKNEKRERREREEQERKERKEREKIEKREKKERKEQEKREREERKQNEKRERREREERQRKERTMEE